MVFGHIKLVTNYELNVLQKPIQHFGRILVCNIMVTTFNQVVCYSYDELVYFYGCFHTLHFIK